MVGVGRIEWLKTDTHVFAVADSVSSGGFVYAVTRGIVRGALPLTGSWGAGEPVYIDSNGLPIHAIEVPTGERAIRIGFAANPTDLEVCIQDNGTNAF